MGKRVDFDLYRLVLFLVMFFFFTPLCFQAFQAKEWVKMGVLGFFALTGLLEIVRALILRKARESN